MKSLLLLCFVACGFANLLPHVYPGWVDYGSYDGLYKIGNLSEPYVPPTNDDRRASRRGAQFLRDVKKFFRTGFYTMPPLDPYYRNSMPPLVFSDDKYLSVDARLSHFNLTGLVAFTSDYLEICYGNGRVDYRISVPQLSVDTLVDVTALVGRIFPFKTTGLLSVLLSDVKVRGGLQVVMVPRHGTRVYQLEGQHTLLHVGDVKAKFTPYLKEPVAKSGALGYGAGVWDDLLNVLAEHIHEYIAHLAFNQANDILDGPTVDQIDAFLLGPD